MESSFDKSIFYEELETATIDLIENNFDDLNKTLTKCSNRFGKEGKQKLLYNELLTFTQQIAKKLTDGVGWLFLEENFDEKLKDWEEKDLLSA